MISKLLHASLMRLGYWTRRKAVLPVGIDYLLDVQRLAIRYGVAIEVIVDVGAHTGQSIGALHSIWPNARILAFEADPEPPRDYRRLVGLSYAATGSLSMASVAA